MTQEGQLSYQGPPPPTPRMRLIHFPFENWIQDTKVFRIKIEDLVQITCLQRPIYLALLTPVRTEVYFCHLNQNAKNIGNFTDSD
jgi:hypothetical protein